MPAGAAGWEGMAAALRGPVLWASALPPEKTSEVLPQIEMCPQWRGRVGAAIQTLRVMPRFRVQFQADLCEEPLSSGLGGRWTSVSCSSQFGSHFLWASSQKTGGSGVSKLIPSKDTSRQNLLTV